MSLDIGARWHDGVHIGYGRFNNYRTALAHAYNPEYGALYEKAVRGIFNSKYRLTKAEDDRWKEIANDDLELFILHSDCDGELSSKECRKIYAVLKMLEPETYKDEHKEFLHIFKHCAKLRVKMVFR
jgi:hypothetical protein